MTFQNRLFSFQSNYFGHTSLISAFRDGLQTPRRPSFLFVIMPLWPWMIVTSLGLSLYPLWLWVTWIIWKSADHVIWKAADHIWITAGLADMLRVNLNGWPGDWGSLLFFFKQGSQTVLMMVIEKHVSIFQVWKPLSRAPLSNSQDHRYGSRIHFISNVNIKFTSQVVSRPLKPCVSFTPQLLKRRGQLTKQWPLRTP